MRQLHSGGSSSKIQLTQRWHHRPVSRWKGGNDPYSTVLLTSRPGVSSSYRSFSSNLPNDVRAKDADAIPPISTSSSTQKAKHKVELRPGPAKPGALDATPKSTSNTLPSAPSKPGSQVSAKPLKPPGHVQQDTPAAASPGPSDVSIVQMAKFDIEEAARHGVLKPPPENANWAYKLFHQAKELFVRIRLPITPVCC